ncbi:MAG: FG-GAP-like repeat-containing protein, partial [Thermoanaerobaculia bacterium]
MKRLFLAAASLLVAVSVSGACVPYWHTSSWQQANVSSIVKADFNDDGFDDLAGATQTQISVLITSGGEVGTPVTVLTSEYLRGLVTLDANGDDKADLLTSDLVRNELVVLPGNGDGTFGAPISTATSIAPSEIAIGHFNGDAHIDVAFRSYSASTIAVWAGDGDGTFTELARTPIALDALAIAAADLDGDELLDVLVTFNNSSTLHFFSGNGNGTFDAPVNVTGGESSSEIAIADLDDDDDLDVVTAGFWAAKYTVLLNNGTGTFAAPVHTSAKRGESSYGHVLDVELGDVNADGHPDLILALVNDNEIGTAIGKGDGTFEPLSFAYAYVDDYYTDELLPTNAILVNMDGGEKPDLVVTDPYYIAKAENNCGDTRMSAGAEKPHVTAGAAIRVSVSVLPDDNGYSTSPAPPAPTGTIAIYEGSTLVASGTLLADPWNPTTIDVAGLAAGIHILRAVYEGDDRYHESQSEPFGVKVSSFATTVTLTPSATELPYGQSLVLTTTMPSAVGSGVGPFQLISDGVADQYAFGHTPPFEHYVDYWKMPVGTHTYRMEFWGNEDNPRALSNLVTVKVVRAPTAIHLSWGSPHMMMRVGETKSVTLDSYPAHGGTVTLYENGVVVGSVQLNEFQSTAKFDLSPSPGRHFYEARYSGNANYLPSSTTFDINVLPNQPIIADAQLSNGFIVIQWLSNYSGYHRVQRLVNGAWTDLYPYGSSSGFYMISNPVPNAPYILRIQAWDYAQQNILGTSN